MCGADDQNRSDSDHLRRIFVNRGGIMLNRFWVRACIAILGALLVLFVVAPFTYAATCTWNGGSGDWHDASKWSCGAVPNGNDDVVITGSPTFSLITISQAAPMNNLTINLPSFQIAYITGTGALAMNGLMSVSIDGGYLGIVTNGSRVPQLHVIHVRAGSVILTDGALTTDSLRTVTSLAYAGIQAGAFRGTTNLKAGARNVETLVLDSTFITQDNITVTQVLSLSGYIMRGDSFAPTTMTLGSNAVMTATDGAALHTQFVNNGIARLVGNSGVDFGLDIHSKLVNNGVIDIRPAPAASKWRLGLSNNSQGQIVNRGVLAINTSRTVELNSQFFNYGLVEVNGGALTTRELIFEQYGGHIQLNGGAVAGVELCCSYDNQHIKLLGGTLGGSGVVTGGIANVGGRLLLDGVLTLTNFYRQSPTATLQVTLTNAAEPVRLNVVKNTSKAGLLSPGDIEIDGTLIVNKAAGFSPKSGDRFVIGSAVGIAQGVFQQSTGNIAPAFIGYASGGQLIVAESDNALVIQAKPNQAKGARGVDNGYAVAFFNPTTKTIQVSAITVSLPISFAYKPGSTAGAYTQNPSESQENGRRLLSFSGAISVAARTRTEFQFGIAIDSATATGNYPINLHAKLANQNNPITLTNVAAIEVPLGIAANVSIGSGTVVTQNGTTNIMFRRGALAGGIPIRVRIVCPPEFVPCGTLRTVYVAQEVNGKYFNVITLTKSSSLANAPNAPKDDGFWDGTMPGEGIIPGVPEKLFPDWDNHRPCIAYGDGGAPQGCVDDGDDIGTPQLYDPSGVIRNAATSQTIPNATVTLYRIPSALPDTPTQTRDCRTIDTRGGNVWTGTAPGGGVFERPGFTPAQIDPNVNPQITGADGRYGWNVVTGCWYVTVSAPRRPSAEPPECATKAVFYPREPGWVFVMNFEKFEQGLPIGCLKLFRSITAPVIGPTDYKTAPCKVLSSGGDIVFHNGQASMNGGYIYCDVNIRTSLAALSPPGVIPQEENYRYYTIIAVGAISDTSVFTTYSNPVGYYRPNNTAYPDHGLFLPWSPNGLDMTSLFNERVNTSFTNTLKLGKVYTFVVEHDGGDDHGVGGTPLYTTTHLLGEDTLAAFAPRERVKVWTDGGAFLVGASFRDLDNRFIGTLDEVIFDPTDIGRPPASVYRVQAWLPIVMKQE
jgi:hypothetical protein